MKKRAEAILNKEINTIITASDYKIVKESLAKLISLSDVLDSMGDTSDADYVDNLTKEAASWWEELLSGGAVGAGGTIWKAIQSGGFNKETLVAIIKKALEGGAVYLLTDSILEQVAKIPYLGFLVKNETVRGLISGALTFALTNSDFVDKLVDHLIEQVEGYLGMGKKEPVKPTPPPEPQVMPASTPPIAQQQPAGEGSSTQSFQMAVPGVKG